MRPDFMKEIRILMISLPLIALTACGGTTPPSTTTYTIGGTVSGLASSASVVLLDNGGDSLTVSASGAFTFKTALASGATYAVTVGTQPSGETCTVSSGSGTVGTANITSVEVSCAANTYTIGGTVSGLGSSASVVLLDNGGDPLTVSANGAFTFKTALTSGAAYAVTVGTQPSGETCTVSSGSGTVEAANITSVAVTCATPTYDIIVQITNLVGTIGVALNDGTPSTVTNPTTTPAPATITFLNVASGTMYDVTVTTQPAGYTCTSSDGSGTVGSANVTVNIACTANPTYDIIVQITNLVGTIGVALNGGTPSTVTNPTTVPAPESITFLNIASGTMYNVTVTTQPAGYTCTTSDGSGTVGSANVTVNIACTTSGGGSGGFWIPYSATPTSVSGKSGLFVIASNSIASSPAPSPTFVTTSVPTLLGAANQGFVSGSTPPGSVTPALIIYAAMGSDGNTHVYGLDLTDTSAPPVPAQITSLSVPPSEHICYEGQVQSDLATPSSLSVVMYITAGTPGAKPGTVGYCGSSPGTFELAHYTDGPSDTPITLNIPGGTTLLSALQNDGGFTALYQSSGQLGGIVLWDASSGDLNFYSDATFTSSTTLLSDVGIGAPCVNVNAITNGNANGGSRLLLNVIATSGTTAYQITASGGTPQQFFAGAAGSCVTDENNLYFIGTPSGGTTSAIYQEPLAATPPAQMLLTLPAQSTTESSSLIGSNDSILLYQNDTVSASGSTSSVFSVPEGKLSTSATAVGGPYSGALVTAFLASPTSSAGDDYLFLTAAGATSSGLSYSSQVLTTSGALAAKSSNSVLASFGPLSAQLDGSILEINGITDTNGGYGGGTVNAVSLTSLKPTPFTTTGGSDYTVPAGYVMSLDGFYGTGIGAGFLFSVADPTAPYIGTAVDVTQSVILPISLTNSSVSALF
ncbi:MAG TPA: hypothetical protein VME23_20705 [Terracidiphilus sp.]|nr:hypothetical protein [Terracidiphilus sp.]